MGRRPYSAPLLSADANTRTIFRKEVKMLSLWIKLTTWVKEEKGASMVEYALLVVLIAIIAIVAVSIAGKQVSRAFSTIANTLSN
jgi:pilus assembly protein Flp/PilA